MKGILERIFCFGSLHLQTLAGQVTGKGIGAEVSLLALPNPEETQKIIMQAIEAKRKREKLNF